jgi:hypothetical protein
MSDCGRTRGLIGRLIEGRVSAEDRAHAAGCPWCGPLLARAGAFDGELRRSARSLVAEALPQGILEQPVGAPGGAVVASRRPAPGLAATLVAIAILFVVTAISIAPGLVPPSPSPGASPERTASPTKPFVARFRSTDVIRGQLAKLGYSCNDGGPLPSPGTAPDAVVRDSTVCSAPETLGPFVLVVIVGEAANGAVVELTIKSDLTGDDSTETRGLMATAMAKVFALALLDEAAGQMGGAWAKVHVVELTAGTDADVVLRQVSFHAVRQANASYRVTVRGAATS